MTRSEAFKNFDAKFEELEVSPYSSAEEYFNGGWNSCLKAIKEAISEAEKRTNNYDYTGMVLSLLYDLERKQ
jgi:hypothetical protein